MGAAAQGGSPGEAWYPPRQPNQPEPIQPAATPVAAVEPAPTPEPVAQQRRPLYSTPRTQPGQNFQANMQKMRNSSNRRQIENRGMGARRPPSFQSAPQAAPVMPQQAPQETAQPQAMQPTSNAVPPAPITNNDPNQEQQRQGLQYLIGSRSAW